MANKAKKITAIVSLSIIGILILATIIMANVDVNHAINCNNPDKIYIQYSSNPYVKAYDEDYDEIVKLINNASKESSLTALFNGTLNDTPVVVHSNTSGNNIPSTSNFYVNFEYNNPQKLMNGNKAYKDENGKDYYYRNLIFSISSTDDVAEVKVYVVPYYNTNGDVNTSDVSYTKYYKVTANYIDLYNYLVDNNYNV